MKEILLPDGLLALADDADEGVLAGYSWESIRGDGSLYVRTSLRKAHPYHVRMHRLLLGAEPGQEVDHINGNGLDNRRANLRFCTHIENCQNMSKHSTYRGVPTTSRFKGVSRRTGKSVWRSTIRINGKTVQLGDCLSEIDAALAYNKAALEHFGEFARLNIV